MRSGIDEENLGVESQNNLAGEEYLEISSFWLFSLSGSIRFGEIRLG